MHALLYSRQNIFISANLSPYPMCVCRVGLEENLKRSLLAAGWFTRHTGQVGKHESAIVCDMPLANTAVYPDERRFGMKSRRVPNGMADRPDGNDDGRVSWKSARGMYLTYCSSDRISISLPHGQSTTPSTSRNLHSNAIPLITKATGTTVVGTSDGGS